MTDSCRCSLLCFVLFLQATSCFPIDQAHHRSEHPRVPRNEVQYANGTVVGSYSYTDSAGNPVALKYYADKIGYGVELNSLKALKVIDTSTPKIAVMYKPSSAKDFMEPMKPLLDLAEEIMNFDPGLSKTVTNPTSTTTNHPDTFNHIDHVSKVIKMNTPDYEKYYQNEVKAPKQCEKDKVRVYLAKERKKKNAVEYSTTKATTYCG